MLERNAHSLLISNLDSKELLHIDLPDQLLDLASCQLLIHHFLNYLLALVLHHLYLLLESLVLQLVVLRQLSENFSRRCWLSNLVCFFLMLQDFLIQIYLPPDWVELQFVQFEQESRLVEVDGSIASVLFHKLF